MFTLRTLADARAIIAAAATAKTAVLIGAGFIGMEAAGALRTRGLGVHVVAREDIPMARVLGDAFGRFLVQLHESHGVVFHRNATATEFDGKALTLDNGTRIQADLLIVGTGVAPRTALAKAAGIQVDNGILVDAYLQTSIAGIYAAGDVARYPAGGELARVEHWVHAERQGQAAAANMLGAARPFTDVPFFWTSHYGMDLRYTGIGNGWDEVILAGAPERQDCTARFHRRGMLIAAASIGRDRDLLEIEAELSGAFVES